MMPAAYWRFLPAFGSLPVAPHRMRSVALPNVTAAGKRIRARDTRFLRANEFAERAHIE